jgi:hypothetical protein
MSKKETLYLVSYADLQTVPGNTFLKELNAVPVVILPAHQTCMYFDTPAEIFKFACEEISELIGGQAWHAAYWSDNQVAKTCFLGDWSNDARNEQFLQNVRNFVEFGKQTACRGLLFDAEYYSSTPQKNGGRMNPKKGAWPMPPDGKKADVKRLAKLYAECMPDDWQLGCYVASGEVRRYPALQTFLRACAEFRKGLLLGEDYTGDVDREAGRRTLSRYVRGYRYDGKIPAGGWVWDPGAKLFRK